MAAASSTSTVDGRPTASATGRSVRRNLILGFNGLSPGRSGRWRLACSSVSDYRASSSVWSSGLPSAGPLSGRRFREARPARSRRATRRRDRSRACCTSSTTKPTRCGAGQAMLRWQADGMRGAARGQRIRPTARTMSSPTSARRTSRPEPARATPPNTVYLGVDVVGRRDGPRRRHRTGGAGSGAGPGAIKARTARPDPVGHPARDFPTKE